MYRHRIIIRAMKAQSYQTQQDNGRQCSSTIPGTLSKAQRPVYVIVPFLDKNSGFPSQKTARTYSKTTSCPTEIQVGTPPKRRQTPACSRTTFIIQQKACKVSVASSKIIDSFRHRVLRATPIRVLLTFSANFRLVMVSARHFRSGATITNINVLLFPPREYCNRYVNLLFR